MKHQYSGKKSARSSSIAATLPKLLPVILLFASQLSFSQSKYIKKFRPLADSLSAAYGVPAAVILGVAILESGSGTSRNCKLLNNHFGVVGKNDLLKTKHVKTRYKQYASSLDSYIDFCKIVARKKFYKKLKDNDNYKLWVEALSKAGYSEIPEYWKTKVLETIRKNKLSPPVKADTKALSSASRREY